MDWGGIIREVSGDAVRAARDGTIDMLDSTNLFGFIVGRLGRHVTHDPGYPIDLFSMLVGAALLQTIRELTDE